MTEAIQTKLKELEEQYNVRILFAVESGSRAWGFDSPNSDYDVRFIYVHKLDWYLSTMERRDVIEQIDGDLDCSGWELRKALKLLAKGNPPLLEWLNSPITYKVEQPFSTELYIQALKCFSPKTAIYHYIGMAKRNYNQYIKDKAYVKHKKYLYVLRPLLACMAIQDMGCMPPTEMDRYMHVLAPYKAYPEVLALINAKKAGLELTTAPASQILNDFIEETMFFFDLYVMDAKGAKIDYIALDRLLNSQVLDYTNENA